MRLNTQTTDHAPLRPALMADMMRYGVVFSPDGDPAPTGDPAPKPAPKSEPKPEPKSEPKDDGVAEALRAQLADMSGKLRAFGDATPDEIRELRELRAKAEEERQTAAAAARKAEEEQLRKQGDFETLKARMAEEHQKELEAARSKFGEMDQTVATLNRRIEAMALTSAFSGSTFIQNETIIGADKALRIYGDHFDVVDGAVVGYDAPRGATKRVPLVDGKGTPLVFDEAIKRLVDVDPDRDRLLKAQQRPGPGAAPSPGVRPAAPAQPELRGAARIAKALPAFLGQS